MCIANNSQFAIPLSIHSAVALHEFGEPVELQPAMSPNYFRQCYHCPSDNFSESRRGFSFLQIHHQATVRRLCGPDPWLCGPSLIITNGSAVGPAAWTMEDSPALRLSYICPCFFVNFRTVWHLGGFAMAISNRPQGNQSSREMKSKHVSYARTLDASSLQIRSYKGAYTPLDLFSESGSTSWQSWISQNLIRWRLIISVLAL